MKKTILLAASALVLTSCWHKLGTLTVVSTRNHESKVEYKPLKNYQKAKKKIKGGSGIEDVIDKAVKEVPGGEFMKNVRFWVRGNGKKIKIEGDVWGLEPQEQPKN